MNIPINRLATYLSLPDNVIVSTTKLSECGFFYTKFEDEVECFSCHIKIKDWKPDDIPAERHFQKSPNCPIAIEAYQKYSQEPGAKKDIANKEERPTVIHNQPLNGLVAPPKPDQKLYINGNANLTAKATQNTPYTKEKTSVNNQIYLSESKNRHPVVKKDILKKENKSTLIPTQSKVGVATRKQELLNWNANLSPNQTNTLTTKEVVSSQNHPVSNPINIISNEDVISLLSEEPGRPEPVNPELTSLVVKRNTQPNVGGQNQETDFTIERNRVASFVGKWNASSPVIPSDLASAGLYYIGPGDKVKCAWCKGGLYNWEVGDTPIGEHAKHFPQCPFIKKKIAESLQPKARTNPKDVKAVTKEISSTQNWQQSPAVTIAQDMGYSLKDIEKAIKTLPHATVYNTESVLDSLFELQTSSDNEATSLRLEDSNPNSSEEGALGLDPFINNLENHFTNMHISEKELTEDEQLSALMDENTRLKDSTTCKICLENDVNTLFLPCRHLVCCEECSEAVKHCPLCRTLIVGTVKTFLS